MTTGTLADLIIRELPTRGLSNPPRMSSQPLPPVFIRRTDGKTFKIMKSQEIGQITSELENKLGLFASRISIAPGGDLFIRPSTLDQQQDLLKTTEVLDGIKISCSLPRSHGTSKVVIHGVPLGDTDEEILKDLGSDYQINYVRRITRGTERTPTPTVILEFKTERPPTNIVFNYMHFKCHPYVPHPMRCTNCNRFGHTKNVCKDKQRCKECSLCHAEGETCDKPRCINCKGEHPSDSVTCPIFAKLKQTSKIAIDKGISLHEARTLLSYSEVLKKNEHTQPRPDTEIEILKSQVTAMQTEIRGLKTELGKIKNLERTVASLEKSIEISQQSQDRLEKKFDIMSHKLEQFIIRLGINIDSTEPTRSSDSESEMEEEPIDETPVLTRSIIPVRTQPATSHIQARRTYASSQSTGPIPKKQKSNSSTNNKK